MSKNILISILILAAALRLFGLTRYPAGLNADEAALGYNAYSLMLTGKDEHGHAWPVNLESFGDFKPAFYSYFLIPFIKVFGLTELAIRLPSALAGILAVLFIYLLTKELTSLAGEFMGLTSALLLAISPWHLHFSRGAWEVNLATTFILLGTWLFLKWLKNPKIIFLLLFTLNFTLSLYTYQSARVIAPLLGLGFLICYFPIFTKHLRQTITAGILLFLLLIPLTYNLITSDASSRFSAVGLLADAGPLNRVKEFRGQHGNPNSPLGRVLHNRPVIYSIQFMKNYLDHFNGAFLFISGDVIPRNRVPETGLLYMTDFILLFLGVIYLLRTSNYEPRTNIIWLWLFIAPVASALTFQTPHALRSQSLVIPLTIISSSGLFNLVNIILKLKIKNLKFIAYGILFFGYFWQVSRYLHQYYIHYPQTYPFAWEYGFKELVAYTESVRDRYDQIMVTDKYDQPYILFLFYSRFPPAQFQGRHKLTLRDKYNFSTVREFDKYKFENTPWEKVRDIHSTLIVAAPEDIPEVGVNVVKTIYFPSNQPAFKIVSN